MVEAHPAATVVLVREAVSDFQVLLVKRNDALDFCGGAWVFPGGRVDPVDYHHSEAMDLIDTARIAAVREVFEETGITIAAERLLFLEHFTTPSPAPKRFSTYFFITAVEDATVRVDGSEIMEFRWLSPKAALEGYNNRSLNLPLPTMIILDKIASFKTIASVWEHLQTDTTRHH
jgi:8-oxo-dGTP pyrophosphatase MutT (NUDIX family)